MRRIYLDHAASTPTHPEIVDGVLPYFTGTFGNPSSIYSCGQEARAAIEEARIKVAGLIGVRSKEPAAPAREARLMVVMDKCVLKEHQKLKKQT